MHKHVPVLRADMVIAGGVPVHGMLARIVFASLRADAEVVPIDDGVFYLPWIIGENFKGGRCGSMTRTPAFRSLFLILPFRFSRSIATT